MLANGGDKGGRRQSTRLGARSEIMCRAPIDAVVRRRRRTRQTPGASQETEPWTFAQRRAGAEAAHQPGTTVCARSLAKHAQSNAANDSLTSNADANSFGASIPTRRSRDQRERAASLRVCACARRGRREYPPPPPPWWLGDYDDATPRPRGRRPVARDALSSPACSSSRGRAQEWRSAS